MGDYGALQKLPQKTKLEDGRCNYRSAAACDGADQPLVRSEIAVKSSSVSASSLEMVLI